MGFVDFVDFVDFGSIYNNLILENYLTMHVSMHMDKR